MVKINYIDPDLESAIKDVNPVIRREVSYSFDIAKRISEVLASKHWSQADLAKATGKKAALVSRWLSGTHNFTIRTLAEIETALGAPIVVVYKTRNRKIVDGYMIRARKPIYLTDSANAKYGGK